MKDLKLHSVRVNFLEEGFVLEVTTADRIGPHAPYRRAFKDFEHEEMGLEIQTVIDTEIKRREAGEEVAL